MKCYYYYRLVLLSRLPCICHPINNIDLLHLEVHYAQNALKLTQSAM